VPLWCTMVYVLDRPLSSNENVALYRVVCGHPRPRSDAVQQRVHNNVLYGIIYVVRSAVCWQPIALQIQWHSKLSPGCRAVVCRAVEALSRLRRAAVEA